MKKIRVLFTIPNFDTAGSGKALLQIAKGLDPQVFSVHIMCMHNKGEFFKVVEDSGLPIHILQYTSDLRPIGKMLRYCWSVSRRFKEIAPDVIHSYHYAPDYTEAIASRMAGIPWVFTKKNMNWGGKSKNAWNLRSFLARKIAVQNTDMLRKFYKGSNKTVLIPRGVDIEYFRSLDNHSKMNFPEKKRYLICVANFVPVKRLEILIQAFNKIYTKHPHWNLLLVGENNNSYGIELMELVLKLDMSERVSFTGKQMDIRPFLEQAEIFVLPTEEKGEGSPVSLLEAMANSKVVIGSDIPGIRDQLAKFPQFLFKASDINELSIVLDKNMSKSKIELQKLGNIFYQHVNIEYPLSIEIERHEQLYKNIMPL